MKPLRIYATADPFPCETADTMPAEPFEPEDRDVRKSPVSSAVVGTGSGAGWKIVGRPGVFRAWRI